MNLQERAIADLKVITGNVGEFASSVSFTSKRTAQNVTVAAIPNIIHLGVDSDGNPIYSKNSTIAVHEQNLTDKSYSVRDSNDEVSMNGDIINFTFLGIARSFCIKSQMPDESFGLLVFFLEDYAA